MSILNDGDGGRGWCYYGAFLGVDDAGGSVDSVFDGKFMLVCVGGGVSGGGGLCRCRCVGGHLLLVL